MPLGVLSGLMTEVVFCMSHACVSVPDTDWVEPVLLWVSIEMPTGSGNLLSINICLVYFARLKRPLLKKWEP